MPDYSRGPAAGHDGNVCHFIPPEQDDPDQAVNIRMRLARARDVRMRLKDRRLDKRPT